MNKEQLLSIYEQISADETEARRVLYEASYRKANYRILSVKRVLEWLNSNRKTLNERDWDTYLTHCMNKLNGNLDGVELELDNSKRRE